MKPLACALFCFLCICWTSAGFAQEREQRTKSGPRVAVHLITGYRHFSAETSTRINWIVRMQSRQVTSSGKTIPVAVRRKQSAQLFTADGFLNYQYLKRYVTFGSGPGS